MNKKRHGVFFRLYPMLILFFLYAPMLVMIRVSFNEENSTSKISGFSLHWYRELISTPEAMAALQNTLVLAVLSSLCAMVLGTAAAVGIDAMRRKWAQSVVLSVTNLPLMNPEIVTGISMMLLFVFLGQLLGRQESLGFGTMLLAHVTFCLPYVILSVLPKLRQTDPHLAEAARDLGCSPWGAFWRAVLPSILSGVVSGLLMSFTLSLDDFVISCFVSGRVQTLPIYIYSMTKRRVKPSMYALSVLVFAAIFLLLIAYNVLQARADKKQKKAYRP
ncbi:MAG: ABC transporter permease [Oscillospiraceae bacterium]|jgi:spermidine/putrescine transport system permease protein|nr:ABC transporter permease [Oscillospiraceae bacterium]